MNATELATKQDIEELKTLVRKLVESTTNEAQPDNRLLDNKQVRAYLGNISEGTLKMLRDTGELTASKIGGKYFYEMKDITAMVRRNKGRS